MRCRRSKIAFCLDTVAVSSVRTIPRRLKVFSMSRTSGSSSGSGSSSFFKAMSSLLSFSSSSGGSVLIGGSALVLDDEAVSLATDGSTFGGAAVEGVDEVAVGGALKQ